MSETAAARPTPGWPRLWLCAVHLTALWTIAFVQPLFDLLGKNAAFFVARDNTPGDVLIFAFGWALGPPLVATLIVGLARAVNERLGRIVHLGFITALAAVLLLQVVKGISAHASVVGPIALVLGLVVAAAYARFAGLRSFVSILGIAPIVVLALLLVFSPVKDIVFPSNDTTAAAASGSRATNPVPVVLMIFDELPTPSLMTSSEHIDAQRYPNFGRLAKTATWYKNASSVSDGTYVAVPAILTGKRPNAQLPTDHSYPDNLFTMLGKTYSQHDQEPITHVCPEVLCGHRTRQSQHKRLASLADDLSIVERRLLLPKGMANRLPPIDRDWEDFNADAGDDGLAAAAKNTAQATSTAPGEAPIRVAGNDLPSTRVKQGRAVVGTMKPGGTKPGLWMVHYVIPHVPWRFLPDGSQYPVSGPTMPDLNDQTWGTNQFLLDQAFQRHLEMLRFGDRLLGDAMDQMKRTGLWDKALVIVVADHGGAVGPKESRRPVTKENFPQVGSVPLFVKLPHQKTGSIKTTLVTTLDVVPTIAKVLGIHNGWHFDGTPVDEPHHPKMLLQRNGRLAKLVGVTPQDFLTRRDAEVKARDARWPAGLAGIWKIGPRPDLVGKPLSSLDVTTGGGESGFLNNAGLYRHVKPTSGVIPAYITGSTKGVKPGTAVAVAINGTIRATGEAYREHGAPRFSMLVPPQSLRRGRNQVEVLAVSGASARELAGTR